jgi:hypothetical protein
VRKGREGGVGQREGEGEDGKGKRERKGDRRKERRGVER